MNVYGYANGDPASYSDPFGLCPTADGGDDGRPCPGPIGQMVDQLDERMEMAVSSVADAALGVAGAITNAVTGLGDLFTAAGLNPSVKGGRDRALAATSFVAGMMMTPEGAVGAHISIDEGRAALATLMAGDYKVIAGAGTAKEYRAAGKLGGKAADWQYVTSTGVLEINGFKWQAHWGLNTVTGETALPKLKAVGIVK